jgi:hypothetical protein
VDLVVLGSGATNVVEALRALANALSRRGVARSIQACLLVLLLVLARA